MRTDDQTEIEAAVQRHIAELTSLREKALEELRAIDRHRELVRDRIDRLTQAVQALEGGEQKPGAQDRPTVTEHTGKYRRLWHYLRSREDDRLPLTFDEIETVLGFGLPASCRRYTAHWYNYDGSAVTRAIQDAGWRARHVNLNGETVELHRMETGNEGVGVPSTKTVDATRPRTLHEAIETVLRSHGNAWMHTREVAEEVNSHQLYRKRDGTPVESNQIHARTRNYGALFERDGPRVRLREESESDD